MRSHKSFPKHWCFTAIYKFGRFGTDNYYDRMWNLHRCAKSADKENVSETSGRIKRITIATRRKCMRKIREIALVTATALLMTMCPVDMTGSNSKHSGRAEYTVYAAETDSAEYTVASSSDSDKPVEKKRLV